MKNKWFNRGLKNNGNMLVVDRDFYTMAECPRENVSLITAAPELLEALERYCDNYARFTTAGMLKSKPDYEVYEQARAAIAKAKGE